MTGALHRLIHTASTIQGRRSCHEFYGSEELSCRRKSTPTFRSANCDRKPGPRQAERSLTNADHSATRRLAEALVRLMPDTTTTFEWQRLIRRARLQPSTKLVAFALCTFANADGSRAYPGVERLAMATRLSAKTVRNGLAALREVGLIERVKEGSRNGRRALADEYELRFPDGLHTRVHMLDPAESWESEECTDACQHPRSAVTTTGDRASKHWARRQEQGNSVPGTPVMSPRSPVTASPITGNEFPPPTHHLPSNQPKHPTSAPVRNATTDDENGGEINNVIPFDRRAQ